MNYERIFVELVAGIVRLIVQHAYMDMYHDRYLSIIMESDIVGGVDALISDRLSGLSVNCADKDR